MSVEGTPNRSPDRVIESSENLSEIPTLKYLANYELQRQKAVEAALRALDEMTKLYCNFPYIEYAPEFNVKQCWMSSNANYDVGFIQPKPVVESSASSTSSLDTESHIQDETHPTKLNYKTSEIFNTIYSKWQPDDKPLEEVLAKVNSAIKGLQYFRTLTTHQDRNRAIDNSIRDLSILNTYLQEKPRLEKLTVENEVERQRLAEENSRHEQERLELEESLAKVKEARLKGTDKAIQETLSQLLEKFIDPNFIDEFQHNFAMDQNMLEKIATFLVSLDSIKERGLQKLAPFGSLLPFANYQDQLLLLQEIINDVPQETNLIDFFKSYLFSSTPTDFTLPLRHFDSIVPDIQQLETRKKSSLFEKSSASKRLVYPYSPLLAAPLIQQKEGWEGVTESNGLFQKGTWRVTLKRRDGVEKESSGRLNLTSLGKIEAAQLRAIFEFINNFNAHLEGMTEELTKYKVSSEIASLLPDLEELALFDENHYANDYGPEFAQFANTASQLMKNPVGGYAIELPKALEDELEQIPGLTYLQQRMLVNLAADFLYDLHHSYQEALLTIRD